MSAALGLYRLQQVDSQMDQIRARLDAIRETLENDVKLRAANKAVSASEAENNLSNSAVKASEAEVESQRIKIEHAEASLYGGQVKNPKELQDLQMEVASLKKYLVTLEERELEAMVRAEETQKVLDEANDKLQQIQETLKAQNRDLTIESDSLNKDLENLEPERNAVIENIEEAYIKIYQQLRQKKNGIAVASFEENSCSACGTTFTQSQQQSARSVDQLFDCPTCGRIIYAN